MGKSILICRTSTTRQEVQSQIEETKAFALADGCKEEDLIIIAKQGASAIKLDDEYIKNMARVKQTIEAGGIDCVYAWALDRIGRNEVVLFEFKQLLIKYHVQLKIKTPTLVLFDADGKINGGMEIALSLFITMAKQEMEQKQERFRRARERNREQGRYNGGILPIGYCAKDGVIVPDEATGAAQLVRDIFYLYSTGRYSLTTLAKEVQLRGIWDSCSGESINFVLHNPAYRGMHPNVKCPPLVDEETYKACRAVAERKSTNIGATKKYWLGSKLIVCPECGRHFVGHIRMNAQYSCVGHIAYKKDCKNVLSLNADQLEALLLHIATEAEIRAFGTDKGKEEQRIADEVNATIDRIELLEKKIVDKTGKKMERLNELFIDGNISKEQYNEKLARINGEVDEIRNDVARLRTKQAILQHQWTQLMSGSTAPSVPAFNEWVDAKDCSELVHKHISKVVPERLSSSEVAITVETTIGTILKFYNRPKKRDCKWFVVDGEEQTPLHLHRVERNDDKLYIHKD